MKLKTFMSKFTLMFLLGVMSFALYSCKDDDQTNASLGTGTVSGIITDDYNAPLQGVEVALSDGSQKATTNEKGEYALSNVPIGKSILTFTRDSYQTASVTVTPKSYMDGKASVNASMEYAAAKIQGVILDAKNGNAPLQGVKVSISDTQSSTTGADGKFSIENLPLDGYTVTFAKDGYVTVVRTIGIDQFIDGTALMNVTMGGVQLLRDKTLDDLKNADHWYYNEYRGGRNSEQYPHWDWSTDYMATMNFYGQWDEQNEGTTLQIRNSADDQKNNPADLNVFDSYICGIKHITEDNKIMTIQCRSHSTSDADPLVYGVQVIDLSSPAPQVVKIGDNRTLNLTDGSYASVDFDLSAYVGKDIVIAIGTYRAKAGDYWKQFVLRRIAFAKQIVNDWGYISGTPINDELSEWRITQETVRSTMPETKYSFTGISPVSGNRDNYKDAYVSWRGVNHIGAEWSFIPRVKDPEPFASDGFVMKTRGGGTPVDTKNPESYFYSKFFITAGHTNFVLKARNFSSTNPTYFKLTAIDENMNVVHVQPSAVQANNWSSAPDGCIKFKHENGNSGNPNNYASFTFDLSAFNGKNVVLVLGVYKGEQNNDENKLCIYSINLN